MIQLNGRGNGGKSDEWNVVKERIPHLCKIGLAETEPIKNPVLWLTNMAADFVIEMFAIWRRSISVGPIEFRQKPCDRDGVSTPCSYMPCI